MNAPVPSHAPAALYRSKSLAAWIALLGGTIGLHRIYLHGAGDKWAWGHVPVTVLGLVGVERMNSLGQDDRLAWLLIPLLGLMVSQAAFLAIVYALTPDERWDAQRNPGQPGRDTRWAPVLAAVAALLFGGTTFIGTITFSIQKIFEWQQVAASTAPPVKR